VAGQANNSALSLDPTNWTDQRARFY
jgi:hypothetical protein